MWSEAITLPMLGFFALLMFGDTVQTITGFAGAILIMPFLLSLVGRMVAVPLVNLLGLVLCIYMTVRERRSIQWGAMLRAMPALLAGMALGAVFQVVLGGEVLRKGYGVFILICVAAMLTQDYVGKSGRFPFIVRQLLLCSAGVVHSVFASGGPILVMVMMREVPDKAKFRATMSAIWVGLDVTLAAQHLLAGVYTGVFFIRFVFLMPATLAGMWLGYWLYRRVSAALFLKLSYLLLAIAGVYTILF